MERNIIEKLRSSGYKVTPQRLAVFEALCKTKEHPNAETLFKELHEKYPMMSLATVYKTLDILEKIKEIQILNTGEDSYRYDADISPHHHIQCRVCGRVDDIFEGLDEATIQRLESKSDYVIEGQQLYLFGVCKYCRH